MVTTKFNERITVQQGTDWIRLDTEDMCKVNTNISLNPDECRQLAKDLIKTADEFERINGGV